MLNSKATRKPQSTELASALLAYARSFGVTDRALQRRLAAQLWRALPRGLGARDAANWLDAQVTNWAFALLGVQISASEVRAAFLGARLDPLMLLRPHDGTSAYAQMVSTFAAAVPMLTPAVTARVMPVQSLTPVSIKAWLFTPLATPAAQPARA